MTHSVSALLSVALVLTGLVVPAHAWGEPPGVSVEELDLGGVDVVALQSLPSTPPAPAPAPAESIPAESSEATDEGSARPLAELHQDSAEIRDDDREVRGPEPVLPQGDVRAPAPAASAPDILTPELDTTPFLVLGVTWQSAPELDGVVIRYRVRESGKWTDWEAVGSSDIAPDADREDAPDSTPRGATDPIVTSGSDGLQLWAQAENGIVTGLKAVLIDPGPDPDPAVAMRLAVASIPVPGQPAIISRSGWGADESMRTCQPDYSSQMSTAAIHHTASANAYGADEVPGILRGFLAYHTRAESGGGRGWCDIGYNFLVDRFGRIFEGRAGGITSTVVGVHTGGFNSRTIGIAAIGEFGAAAVPDVMTAALAALVAWKFSIHGITAGTSVQMVSGGGASKYPAGTVVTFPTIYGHRDAQLTSCPGQNLYDLLPYLQTRVSELANPAVSVSPRGTWDSVTTTPTSITVSGWALDPETTDPIIVEVRVNGELSTTVANLDRPDIGALYPALGSRHGFSHSIPHGAGTSVVCLAAANTGNGVTVSLGCRTVTVRNSSPIGAVDAYITTDSSLTVAGWTLDPDTPTANEVHIYIDGAGVALTADQSRPDVAVAHGKGDKHGFTHMRTLSPGEHSVCVYGIDSSGGPNTLIDCRTITVGAVTPRSAPIGRLDNVNASNTAIAISGWTLDPDTTTPIDTHVYVDGNLAVVRADGLRPDVGQGFGKGDRHGFTYVVNAAPGPHDLCVHGINAGPGSHTLLGCRSIFVPDTLPVGNIDAMIADNNGITISGWAFDPDSWGPNQVHIYVDGVGVSILANLSRPDVAAAFQVSDRHGFSHRVDAAPGPHSICAFSINTSFGANRMLDCRTFNVSDRAPIGVVDAIQATEGLLTFSGWTLDPDTNTSNEVHIYIDGVGTSHLAELPRLDVAAVYGTGDKHGFHVERNVRSGPRSICIFGINTAAGAHTVLDCRVVDVP